MINQTFNRIEKKFLVTLEQFEIIQLILNERLVHQEGIDSHEQYHVSNIYYDTSDHLIIKKSVSKPVFKQKLRLRAYGNITDDSLVFLELKRKINGFVNKRRSLVSVDEAEGIVSHHNLPETQTYHQTQILKEILFFAKQYHLTPQVYLYYERETYGSSDKNQLRITFDHNIITRRYDLDIKKHYGTHLLDEDIYVMEIKTNHNYPMWLTEVLTQNNVFATSFSKYGTEFYQYLNQSKETRDESCINPYLQVLR